MDNPFNNLTSLTNAGMDGVLSTRKGFAAAQKGEQTAIEGHLHIRSLAEQFLSNDGVIDRYEAAALIDFDLENRTALKVCCVESGRVHRACHGFFLRMNELASAITRPRLIAFFASGKVCPVCDTFKPFSEFAKETGKHNAHSSYCRECKRVTHAAYIKARKEKQRQQTAAILATVEDAPEVKEEAA